MRLVGAVDRGGLGAVEAALLLGHLERTWMEVMVPERGRSVARGEWDRMVSGAGAKSSRHVPSRVEGDGVYLVRASTLEPEAVEYLEEGLLPLRVITLVTGVDGVGKSTILYDKGAGVTCGKLAGSFEGESVDVVIASSEDHPQSVILPRLIAASADLDRVHIVKVRREGFDGEIVLPEDLTEVAERVAEVEARLLIVDPLVAHLPLNIDSYKAQHVRAVLAPLARLAEDQLLAVAAVVHFNGTPSTDVRTRISGSKALRDAARSVLVCGRDPDDETRYLLLQDKNSFGPRPKTAWSYEIKGATVNHRGQTFLTSRVEWGDEVEITSYGLLAPTDPSEQSSQKIAAMVILDALAAEALPWSDIAARIHAQGVSERTGRRARDNLKSEGWIQVQKGERGWLWWTTANLSTVDGQVDAGQVENLNADKKKPGDSDQVVHLAEGGQVGQVDPEQEAPDRSKTTRCDWPTCTEFAVFGGIRCPTHRGLGQPGDDPTTKGDTS
jgi:hypothetical protein